jgi:hypothetical protein
MRLFYILLYTVYIILGPNYSLNFWTAELHVQPSHMLDEHGVLKQSFSEKRKRLRRPQELRTLQNKNMLILISLVHSYSCTSSTGECGLDFLD